MDILVNVLRGLFLDSKAYDDLLKQVDRAVAAFTSSVVDLTAIIGIKSLVQGQELQHQVNDFSNRFETSFESVEPHIRAIAGWIPRSLCGLYHSQDYFADT
jgi:hypothetical protein